MNETLKDIHWMLARIWIDKDGLGLNAYDEPKFKTLAEKYGFTCDCYDEAKAIIDEKGECR